MKFHDSCDNVPHKFPPKLFQRNSTPNNLITIYTIFSILLLMKQQLGLEAMVEYLEQYIVCVDNNHPRLQAAVTEALALMNIEKMYKDTVNHE